jgi:5'-deoxynucleotidase YfbR-like HD superfamily hydrolase
MSGYIRTFTGKRFYPLDANPEDVDIIDIAHHLSHQCRWAGAVKSFYSVALHSLHVSMMTHKEYALGALLHDASEAYLCDMPKPAKLGMPEYNAHEDRLTGVISEALGFVYPFAPEIHKADQAALYLESKYFFTFERGEIPIIEPPRHCNWNFEIVCSASPSQVKAWFISEFERLKRL